LRRMLIHSLLSLKRTQPAVQMLPDGLLRTDLRFSVFQFFFMHANLSKSPAYRMSTELTMYTYNKVFKLPFSLWSLASFSSGQLENYCCLPDVCCLFIMHILLQIIKVWIWTRPVPVALPRITLLYSLPLNAISDSHLISACLLS
jgi:hypothetical protein